ncbi:hypothetical protein EVAR_29930_1 [Eumeta japonica]|uniref:Uncharacterized protein n=1 Tax=Eumeta variegata TaxID=151549 RepID=A0A4C1V6U7_EUMVA|nr:hypothetical protein EVAR_29930_1 [Eumeta japonica]
MMSKYWLPILIRIAVLDPTTGSNPGTTIALGPSDFCPAIDSDPGPAFKLPLNPIPLPDLIPILIPGTFSSESTAERRRRAVAQFAESARSRVMAVVRKLLAVPLGQSEGCTPKVMAALIRPCLQVTREFVRKRPSPVGLRPAIAFTHSACFYW